MTTDAGSDFFSKKLRILETPAPAPSLGDPEVGEGDGGPGARDTVAYLPEFLRSGMGKKTEDSTCYCSISFLQIDDCLHEE